MATRIYVVRGMREALQKFVLVQVCPVCEDDLDIHDWFEVKQQGTPEVFVSNCDRA